MPACQLHYGKRVWGAYHGIYWLTPLGKGLTLVFLIQHKNICIYRVDSRFAPFQWETILLCNVISHWLGVSLESALYSKILAQQSWWGCTGFTLSICPSVCRVHGFWSITSVCFGISISKFRCTFPLLLSGSLLIWEMSFFFFFYIFFMYYIINR